jgi:methylaspartate mutase epsilon subunit
MRLRTGHGILLGGIGGDSHSVGLHILHRALTANGYRVHFLGTQNRLEDFVRRAPEFDVVMISNMDGHAGQYLRQLRRPAPAAGSPGHRRGPLWYLGGNLTISEGDGCREQFEALGFDRVYPKFVDLTTVLAALEQDLRGIEPSTRQGSAQPGARLDDDRFFAQREEVLAGWPTGAAARSLVDNADYLRRQPSFPALLAGVQAGRRPMVIQPRSGVPDIDAQIELFRRFREQAVQAVSYQVDSLTRNNDYRRAAAAIAESSRTGRAVLNGFPVINHGVAGLRRVVEAVELPLQTRHSTRDPRLLAEISYAGGVTAFEGGAICYNVPYYKDYPLRDSIAAWKYVDRLTGLYCERHGIALDREFFGTLTATLLPPCIPLVTNIAEAVLAATQGVRCVSLGYAEQGNRVQDIAAIRVQAELARRILDEMGYRDVTVHTVFHQYMAAFPLSEQRSGELIFGSAVTAALSGATRLITKTPAGDRAGPARGGGRQPLHGAGGGGGGGGARAAPRGPGNLGEPPGSRAGRRRGRPGPRLRAGAPGHPLRPQRPQPGRGTDRPRRRRRGALPAYRQPALRHRGPPLPRGEDGRAPARRGARRPRPGLSPGGVGRPADRPRALRRLAAGRSGRRSGAARDLPPPGHRVSRGLLGILGGMGPLASAELVHTLYRLNAGGKEQEMPACILYSDPSIPDRTTAILAGDTMELVARITAALEALAAQRVDRIVIACVTAHHVLPQVPEALRRRVISLIELAIDEILAAPRRCLLLCTTGTRRARIFEGHERWGEVADQVDFLDEADQHELHRLLYCLKELAPAEDCLRWLDTLPAKYQLDHFIFGCTELHLIHRALESRAVGRDAFCIIDPLLIAARDVRKLLTR